jgi:S-DNA-T family DNA segregation ATPase FtsK/SpoIIIE
MQNQLHTQANQIEWLLAAHRAPARVTGGRVTPLTIQFQLMPAPATRVSRVRALTTEIALLLNVATARLVREDGALHIEIPRPDAHPLPFLELCARFQRNPHISRKLRHAGTVLLGLNAAGIPLLLRLGAPDVPHLLIAGTTGSGKSHAARTLLASLVLFQPPREIQLLLVDPKGSDYRVFQSAPHLLCPIVSTIRDARDRLEWLADEMERRQRENLTHPRIVLLLDELADLLMQGGSPLEDLLTRLVQRGRSAGISVVACTQKPTVGVLGSLVTGNFPVRLVGKVTGAHEALIAAGVPKSGAESLTGRGDFLLVANGEIHRVRIGYLPFSADADLQTKFFR